MIWKYHVTLVLFIATTVWTQDKGGRWQFEDNGSDTADWDNQDDPGILQADATYRLGGAAEGNFYLFIDTLSTIDYLKIHHSADLDFSDEDIGISMWIYPIILNGVHYLLNKGDQFLTPKTTNYALRISSDKKLEFLIRDPIADAKKVTSHFNILANQWTFVAAFYD